MNIANLFFNWLTGQQFIKYMDGGGGGGSQPTQSNVYQTNIPDYARPYVETMLGTAQQQIFDYAPSTEQYEDVPIYEERTVGRGGQKQKVQTGTERKLVPGSGDMVPTTMKGYKPFNQDARAYFAGAMPMQEQARTAAANISAAPQLAGATGIAAEAGLRGLDARYNPSAFTSGYNSSTANFNQGAAQDYMNPYMQSVVDMQQQDAQRQADIATTGRNAQAVGAGAFGGSRQAIMDAEAAKNLASQKGSIQATGLQNAYGQAQQQFNADQARQQQARQFGSSLGMQAQQLGEQSRQYGAGLGMQGLQTALQGAGALGQLGQTQYGQQVGNINLQNQMGAQQQQEQQNILNQQIQNYATAQQYPMLQLGNMSNLLRGLPMQSTSVQNYQAAPSSISQLGGLGLTAAGIAGMTGIGKAKGGRIKAKKRPAGLAALALSKMV